MSKPRPCPHHRDGCHKNTRVHRVYAKLAADKVNEVISAGHKEPEWVYIGTHAVCHDCFTMLGEALLNESPFEERGK